MAENEKPGETTLFIQRMEGELLGCGGAAGRGLTLDSFARRSVSFELLKLLKVGFAQGFGIRKPEPIDGIVQNLIERAASKLHTSPQ